MLFFSLTKQVNLNMATNDKEILSSIEIETGTPAKKSVIWLHGLGADGSDFVPIVPELHLPKDLNVRFIFPHAPIMPITINNGYEMRAWYDILSLSINTHVDITGITKSMSLVEQLINKEVERGIATSDIILAGFSQGAAIALTTGLCYSKPLAGILALSGYLPLPNETLEKANGVNRQTPLFIAHGTEDPIVPYALGKATYVALQQAGYKASWHSYQMPHSVCAAEIQDMSQWLQSTLQKR